jgi:hypothetical protein
MNVRARILKFLNGLDVKEAEKEVAAIEGMVQECRVAFVKLTNYETSLREDLDKSKARVRFLKSRERKLLQDEEFA